MTAYGSAPVLPTVLFAVGAVIAFMAVDLLSVLAAVGTAAGLARLIPGVIM